ncbi:MAG: hypothetical protein ACKO6N_12145 [Myxococcota bacterium]
MRDLQSELFELDPLALQNHLKLRLGDSELATALREVERISDLFHRLPPVEGPVSTLTLLEMRSLAASVSRYQLNLDAFLTQLFQQQHPDTCARLYALVMGESPLALPQGMLMEALSLVTGVELDALQASYALTRDLEDTTERAQKGRRAVAQVHCRTGRPFTFMRRQLLTQLEPVLEAPAASLRIDEEPLGLRVQIHRRHVLVHLYSERGQDISRAFPEVTSALEKALSGTDDLILEGILYRADGNASKRRHALQARLLSLPLRRGEPPKTDTKMNVLISELLRQGREDLMLRGVQERRTRARQLLRSVEGVKMLDALPLSTPSELSQRLKALTTAHQSWSATETLVAYNTTAPYTPGVEGSSFQLGPRLYSLLLTGVEVGSDGTAPTLRLACMHEGRPVPIGHTRLNKEPALVDLLKNLLARHTLIQHDGLHLLRPGIVVEARAMRLRKATRRPAGVGLDGLEVMGLRLELHEEHVLSREGLIQLAEAMEKLELPAVAYAWASDNSGFDNSSQASSEI